MKSKKHNKNEDDIFQSIECPNCGRSQLFEFHISICKQEDPELFDGILDGSTFRFNCTNCHHEQLVAYNLVVADFNVPYIIRLIHAQEEVEIALASYKKEKIAFIGDDLLKLRIVRSLPELMEKLKIFIDNYDDRVIELLKAQIRDQIVESNKSKIIKIHYLEDNHEFLKFVIEFMGGEYVYEHVGKEEYIRQQLVNKLILKEQAFIVDSNWVQEEIGS